MLKCCKGYEVAPQRSDAGFYMGTFDPQEGPNCRLSSQYAKTATDAEKLPLDRQNAMENRFCNGCGNCGIKSV